MNADRSPVEAGTSPSPAFERPNHCRFAGPGAIVTGAGRGIGQAIVERLAVERARVMVAAADDGAAAAAAAVRGGAVAKPLDITRPSAWAAMVERAQAERGRLDILVNNAGIAGRSAPIWEQSEEEWRQVIEINLSGVFYGCRAVVPTMVERGYGRIVNVASIAGKEGNPNADPYSAAKSGVIGLTKAVAKEVATKGVLINAIAPAAIEMPILAQVGQEHIRYMTSRIPMGRVGQPHEVAALVAFLCSDDLSFSTVPSTTSLAGGQHTDEGQAISGRTLPGAEKGNPRMRPLSPEDPAGQRGFSDGGWTPRHAPIAAHPPVVPLGQSW